MKALEKWKSNHSQVYFNYFGDTPIASLSEAKYNQLLDLFLISWFKNKLSYIIN